MSDNEIKPVTDIKPDISPPTPAEDQDPTVLGVVTADERNALEQIRFQIRDTVLEVGNLEDRKVGVLAYLQQLKQGRQKVMQEIGAKYNVPNGTTFQIEDDGTIRLMPNLNHQGTPPE